ncbi:MAG: phage portal protein [bacterium]
MAAKTAIKKQVHGELIAFDELESRQYSTKVEKQSQQATDKATGLLYQEPRIKFADLLDFMDLNTWHRRCIALKARLVAGLGWQLITNDDNKEPDDAYNKIHAFLTTPNENVQDSFTEIMYKYMTDYYALGNAFLEISRNMANEIEAIYHVRGRNMRRKLKNMRGQDGKIRAVKSGFCQVIDLIIQSFVDFGVEDRGEKNEIIHHFQYDANDDYYGVPEWLPALAVMILDRSAVEYNAFMFDNEMTAKFLLIIEGGNLSASARTQLKKFLAQKAMGVKNTGRAFEVSIDDPNVKIRIEKLNVESKEKDLSFSVGRGQNRDEIISAHGVPPRMVGIMAAGQLGGVGEIEGQLKTFKESTITPDQQSLETLLNKTIISSFDNHKWSLKFNEMDITDMLADTDRYTKLKESGILLVDEIREEIGRGPMPNTAQVTETEVGKAIVGNLAAIRKYLDVEE